MNSQLLMNEIGKVDLLLVKVQYHPGHKQLWHLRSLADKPSKRKEKRSREEDKTTKKKKMRVVVVSENEDRMVVDPPPPKTASQQFMSHAYKFAQQSVAEKEVQKKRVAKVRQGCRVEHGQVFLILPSMKQQFQDHYLKTCYLQVTFTEGSYLLTSVEYRNALINASRIRKDLSLETLDTTKKNNADMGSGKLVVTRGVRKTKKTSSQVDSSSIDREIAKRLSSKPVTPRPHQQSIAEAVNTDASPAGMIFYHEAGTGKTLTALFSAVRFVLEGLLPSSDGHTVISTRRVVIAVPVSLTKQWEEEIRLRINPDWETLRNGTEMERKKMEELTQLFSLSQKSLSRSMSILANTVQNSMMVMTHDAFNSSVQRFANLGLKTPSPLQQFVISNPEEAMVHYRNRDSAFMYPTFPTMVIIDEAHNLRQEPVSKENKKEKDGVTATVVRPHMSKSIFDALLLFATKILFLTATPIVNAVTDINVMVRSLDLLAEKITGKRVSKKDGLEELKDGYKRYENFVRSHPGGLHGENTGAKTELQNIIKIYNKPAAVFQEFQDLDNTKNNKKQQRKKKFEEAIRKYINFQERSTTSGDFPRAVMIEKYVKEDEDKYWDEYIRRTKLTSAKRRGVVEGYGGELVAKCEDNENKGTDFYFRERIAAAFVDVKDPKSGTHHKILSPKLKFILTDHPDNNYNDSGEGISLLRGSRTVIFTNYQQLATLLQHWLLKKYDTQVKVFLINGAVSAAVRRQYCKEFNSETADNNNTGKIIILMQAGTEGIDLKAVNNIVFLDEVWTQANFDQIVGRGVRFKSHAAIQPPEHRMVKVWNIYNAPPASNSGLKTADDCIRLARLKKSALTNEFRTIFTSLSPRKKQQIPPTKRTRKTTKM